MKTGELTTQQGNQNTSAATMKMQTDSFSSEQVFFRLKRFYPRRKQVLALYSFRKKQKKNRFSF